MSNDPTRLFLIRHGETPWNARGRWQGHADPGLSAAGRKQAADLAATLCAEPGRFTRVLVSDLARAQQTAMIVAEALGLELEMDRRLRELDVGSWSGLTRAEIEARDRETLLAFESGEPSVRPGGGESRIEIRERAHACVCEIARRYKGERLLVVTHLGIIRALVPGADPQNADLIEVVAEEIAARPIDRVRRREDGAL